MKNTKLSQLDNQQISKHMFDEENDAQRVIIVSGEVPDVKVSVDPQAITDAIQKGLEGFKVNSVNPPSLQIERIEVPVIIKETVIEKVEIPVIIKEIEYREIKVPFEIVKTIEIEKPVFLKEQVIQVVRGEESKELKYLRVAVGCLIVLEIITLLISRH